MQTTTVYYTSIYPSYSNADSQNNTLATEQANTTFTSKRRQVKNACTNCQRACKKCDDARPCPRCVKYDMPGSCVSSVRKERRKGIKRGPYKRKQKSDQENSTTTGDQVKTETEESKQDDSQPAIHKEVYQYPSNLTQYGAYYGANPSGTPSDSSFPKNQIQEYVLPIYSPYPTASTKENEAESTKDDKLDQNDPNPTEEESKFARLTELCSAALKENSTPTD